MKYEDIQISVKELDGHKEITGLVSISVILDENYTNNQIALDHCKKLVREKLIEMIFGDLRKLARGQRESLHQLFLGDQYISPGGMRLMSIMLSTFEKYGNHLVEKPKA